MMPEPFPQMELIFKRLLIISQYFLPDPNTQMIYTWAD
jgi:hypothetical protein